MRFFYLTLSLLFLSGGLLYAQDYTERYELKDTVIGEWRLNVTMLNPPYTEEYHMLYVGYVTAVREDSEESTYLSYKIYDDEGALSSYIANRHYKQGKKMENAPEGYIRPSLAFYYRGLIVIAWPQVTPLIPVQWYYQYEQEVLSAYFPDWTPFEFGYDPLPY